jgi:hypothetical protein
MRPAVVRLLVAALLFAGWVGYLVYLVVTTPRTPAGTPLVLSRPQILVSEFDVVGEVERTKMGDVVKVLTVLYPDSEKGLEGKQITITNLDQCKALPRADQHTDQKAVEVPPDYSGPGQYLLPLRKVGDGLDYEVVPTPGSPGYPPNGLRLGPPRIYPLLSERVKEQVLAQYRQILKEKL